MEEGVVVTRLTYRRVFDLVPDKSASELQGFLSCFNGREKVHTVCVDLCSASVWFGVIVQTPS